VIGDAGRHHLDQTRPIRSDHRHDKSRKHSSNLACDDTRAISLLTDVQRFPLRALSQSRRHGYSEEALIRIVDFHEHDTRRPGFAARNK